MKKLVCTLIVSALVSASAVALAGKPPANLEERLALVQIKGLEARKAMLVLCVPGDDAAKYLASDNEKRAKLEATLSDDAKKTLPDALALIDTGVKTSWDNTPEAQRNKSCEQLKEKMASGK